MDIGSFKSDVVVSMSGDNNEWMTIANVVDAAECLTFDWPATSGRRYQEAQAACVAVLDGKLPEDHARSAFLRAAEEADVVILVQ